MDCHTREVNELPDALLQYHQLEFISSIEKQLRTLVSSESCILGDMLSDF